MTAGLLRVVGGVELGTVAVLLAAYVAHSLWVALAARPAERRLVQLRQDIIRAVGAGSGRAVPSPHRRSRLYRRALEDLAGNVSGEGAAWIQQAAGEVGLADRAARWCRNRRWWRRLRGVRLFDLFGGGADLVPMCLDDTHPLVRAAAAAWVARNPTPALVEPLLAMLDDPEGRCRLAAQDALIRLGAMAAEPLAAHLSRADAPGRALALGVAIGLADARFLGPGLIAASDPDAAVRAQAAALLGAVAGPKAEQAMVRLLHDPSEPVRVAAARGSGTLGAWTLAPDLARSLRDRAWDVRKEAALALRRLGPGGRLYLRRALIDPDPFAADMARQVLDLPEVAPDRLELAR